MPATQERRHDDSGFWAWHRVYQTLCCDRTGILSFWVGLIGLALKGILILLNYSSFPPNDVQFLLRQLIIPLTEHRLGWILLIGGLIQCLLIGTRNHTLRGWTALINGSVALLITVAYMFADLPTYFQAWVSYLGLIFVEGFLAWRNFNEQGYEEKVQEFVRRRVNTPPGEPKLP